MQCKVATADKSLLIRAFKPLASQLQINPQIQDLNKERPHLHLLLLSPDAQLLSL